MPQKGKDVRLVKATKWELLNLDTDTILKMPSDVGKKAGISEDELGNLLTKHLYECIGITEFNKRHGLTQNPCVVHGSKYLSRVFRQSHDHSGDRKRKPCACSSGRGCSNKNRP